MPPKVCVTRITVDYVINGKSFMMVFSDPMSISSIVLDRADLKRAMEMQNIEAKKPNSKVPAVTTRAFKPEKTGSQAAGITIVETTSGKVAKVSGPSLWWHSGCRWSHPQGETPPVD